MRAFDVFTLFQMGLQVHGEQRRAVGVVGTANRSVVTAHFMFSATQNRVIMLSLHNYAATTEITSWPCERKWTCILTSWCWAWWWKDSQVGQPQRHRACLKQLADSRTCSGWKAHRFAQPPLCYSLPLWAWNCPQGISLWNHKVFGKAKLLLVKKQVKLRAWN